MKKNIVKITYITNIILVVFILLNMVFITPLLPYDELWNFQNIFKMYNGFKIYNDCNVIITPLFFYIENIIFHLLSANLLTFRISNIFLVIINFFFIYKLQNKLKIPNCINIFFIILMIFGTFELYAPNGANYNTLSLIFYTIGMYLYFSDRNSNIAQGFIVFLLFFTKQNIAIFYALAIIIWEFYNYKFSKIFFKNQFQKLFAFLIPSTFIILFLYLGGNLENFINYTFGGIFDFSVNNLSFCPEKYDLFVILLAIILSISLLINRKKIINYIPSNFLDNLLFLFIFSIFASLILYPICNPAHCKMIISFYYIILAYILSNVFNGLFDDKKIQDIFKIIVMILLLIFALKLSLEFYSTIIIDEVEFISDFSSPYYGVALPKDYIDKIDILENYVSYKNNNGIDVIICSSDSAFVMIPLKQSHGPYDLIFYGNLGYNGIEKMKQDILSRKHTEFLVLKDEEDLFDQEVTEIRDFMIENLTKCGEISNYDVYCNY